MRKPKPIELEADDYSGQLALVCSTDEAAELLGVSRPRIKLLCQQGRLAAKKFSRDWIICRSAVVAFATLPPLPPGRKPRGKR